MAAISSEPGTGYEALTTGAGLHRAADRKVLRVEGDRAPAMLQGLISADIRDGGPEAPGAWPTLILDPKGRVLADAVVLRVGDVLLLDVPDAAWAGLAPHLGRYLPPRFARLEPSGLDAWRLRGPAALDAAAALDPALGGLAPPLRAEKRGARFDATPVGDGFAIRVDGRSGPGVDLYLPTGEEPRAAQAVRVSTAGWEAWRIERGIPAYGSDVTTDNLPQETGLVADATSFEKGCYTGQEVLARIHYRGKVNRRLMNLRPADAGSPMPRAGDGLSNGERVVGHVTSSAASPALGWAALGYVRREVAPGSVLEAETRDGTRTRVVATEAAPDT